LKTSIDTDDGSGLADFDTYPNAVGSKWELDFDKLTPFSDDIEALMTAMKAGATVSGRAGRVKNVLFTLSDGVGGGGNDKSFACPMRINKLTHSMQRKKNQTFKGSMVSHGTPTAPSAVGTHILDVIFVGDGLLSLVTNTGVGEYEGVGLVTDCEIAVDDAKMISVKGTLQLQGEWTYVTS
jgi:hypothetical protein